MNQVPTRLCSLAMILAFDSRGLATETLSPAVFPANRMVGTKVLPARVAAVIRERPSESSPAVTDFAGGRALNVLSTSGGWLNVGFGWIRHADVVPMAAAREHFSRALTQLPSPFAHCGRACALLEREDFARATKDIDAAIALDATFGPAYCCRGDLCSVKKDYVKAIGDFTRAIELGPHFLQAYRGRAEVHIRLSEYKAAAADLGLSRINAEHEPNLLAMLGVAQYLNGDDDAAISALSEAIRVGVSMDVKGTCAKALLRRGESHAVRQRYGPAIADLDRAIGMDAELQAAYMQRATVYAILKRYEVAARDFRRAIDLDPTDAIAHLGLGCALRHTGDPRSAIKHLTRSIGLGYSAGATYYMRGNARYDLGDHDAAIQDYTTALELGAPAASTYAHRGAAYVGADRCALALKDFDKSIKLSPQDPGLYQARAAVLRHLGRDEDAKSDLATAARLGAEATNRK